MHNSPVSIESSTIWDRVEDEEPGALSSELGAMEKKTEGKNKLRRNLSVHDMGGKKRPLQRSSTSDLTDEASATPTEELGECDLNLPYAEAVTIAGVSDIPVLHPTVDEEAPPALSRTRNRKPAVAKPKLNAVVSLIAPHKLLILSKDFCDLFGYAVEAEICGRAVKILQGPRTDPCALSSAIKSCAAGTSSARNVVLYDRDGNDIEVEASFSPYLSGDESLAGCLLEVSPRPPTY